MSFLERANVDSLRTLIVERGCYAPDENLRIYEKWFAAGPRHYFRAVDRKYGLTNKVLADVGCAYGTNLVYARDGSYGIEIESYEVRFAQALGLTIYQRNILSDDLSDLPPVEAVWCSAVLEHVESPHVFLRKLYGLLKPEGLLALYVPTIPLIPGLRHLPGLSRYFTGYLYGDHINAFVPETLRFFCERAGFKTLETSPFYPGALGVLNHVPLAQRLLDGCVYLGARIPDWEYPPNSTRQVADNLAGFTFKGQVFPSDNEMAP